MKNILITGHGGFIGTHLIKSLEKKFNIIGISDKFSDTKIQQIKKDIRKISDKDIPKKIDHIIHLAAITDVIYCQNNPTKCFDVNVQGTQNMLEIARKRNLKFVFLSTSHVFGVPVRIPINENHPRSPNSVYSSSKLMGEILCEEYSRSYNLDISIVRLFSVFGPNSPDHLVTSRIISQLFTKNVITLGNLKPKRDFIYINDVISAIGLVLRNTSGFNSFNVGSGKSISILDLYVLLKKISGIDTTLKPSKDNLRKNDVKNIISDSKKLKKLGWKPKFSVEEGLESTLKWHISNNQIKQDRSRNNVRYS